MDMRTVHVSDITQAAAEIVKKNRSVLKEWEASEKLPQVFGDGGAFLYLDMSDGRLFMDLDMDKNGADFSIDSDVMLVAHAENGQPQNGDQLDLLIEKAILDWRGTIEERAEGLIMDDRIDMLYRKKDRQNVLYSFAGSTEQKEALEADRSAEYSGRYRYRDNEGKMRMAEIPLHFCQAMAVLQNWKERGQSFVTADGIRSEAFDIRDPYKAVNSAKFMSI